MPKFAQLLIDKPRVQTLESLTPKLFLTTPPIYFMRMLVGSNIGLLYAANLSDRVPKS